MNETRNNGQNTGETDIVSETVETAAVSNEPVKVDSIAAMLVDKEAGQSQSNQENNVERPDNNKEKIDTDAAGIGIVQGIGHQLKAARMARSMSIEDVSRQLRISVQQIEAIEKEDFAKLPGRTFLRGFVRNYSNLMQLDPAPILKLLPQSQSTGVAASSKYQTQELSFSPRKAWSGYNYNLSRGHDYREKKGHGFLLKTLIIGSLCLIGYAIFQSVSWEHYSFFKKEPNTDVPMDTGAESEMGTMELELPLPPAIPLDGQDAEYSIQSMEIAPLDSHSLSSGESLVSSISQDNALNSGLGTLYFNFRDESWVEVRDRADKVIFEQLNTSGSEQVIDGKRPLSLVVGNAANVHLTFNGRSIDLAPYTDKKKGVARFTLE
jgi:cytoskeleton protein RodZ